MIKRKVIAFDRDSNIRVNFFVELVHAKSDDSINKFSNKTHDKVKIVEDS